MGFFLVLQWSLSTHWNWIPGIHQRNSYQDPLRRDGRTIWIWEAFNDAYPPFFPEFFFGFKKNKHPPWIPVKLRNWTDTLLVIISSFEWTKTLNISERSSEQDLGSLLYVGGYTSQVCIYIYTILKEPFTTGMDGMWPARFHFTNINLLNLFGTSLGLGEQSKKGSLVVILLLNYSRGFWKGVHGMGPYLTCWTLALHSFFWWVESPNP